MALIVLLRGINVGGYRILRPSILAKGLGDYDVVNVGAAGTFVVRNPGPRVEFLSSLRRRLSGLWLRSAMAVTWSVWRWSNRSRMNSHARILSNL